MTLEQYKQIAGLSSLSEVGKVCYLAFYFLKSSKAEQFSVADASKWLTDCRFSAPNQSRLNANLRASRDTTKASCGWRLKHDFIVTLETKFPQLSEKSQNIVDSGTILPGVDYDKTRGYIESLAKQINATFEHNLFDGTAVLMRRLMEILLILSYRHLKIEGAIQDQSGNFVMLEGIVNNAKTNSTLSLSRNGKASLDKFRELGNFSAHKVEYTCKREYIQPLIQEYRALIGELLHKAGIRT